ncbi:alpha/beta fold hydrolase [Roseofilum casamattae]|uniref:Alpha/beta hydrolase n=1 Tax=Roseofilum casamattae BLCC-M143 TaxID=3022442 RepID=A0ABT7BUQ1_9CYAN|nr:alpha/beta hydrolase [Roseofilum casamattae]MDJ1182919.1 alpha/beta hydrolase [Roseofilum casamattae BLCC-M143]
MNPILTAALNPTSGITEATSIAAIQAIQETAISTPLSPNPITTSTIQQGTGGTPIVLLHGFDSSLLEFRRLIPQLAPHREIWAIDLLGFGFTERPTNLEINPDAIKLHLHSVWKQLINQPVILVGVSMGGAAAIEFSLSYPEAVEQLVLIDSAGFAKSQAIKAQWLKPLVYGAAEILRQDWVRQSVGVKAYYDRNLASVDARLCAALHLQMPNWREAMVSFTLSGGYNRTEQFVGRVAHPTLVLWGDSDRILGIKDAPKFPQVIPDCELVWIEKCGHVPHLEKPERTAELILQGLSRSTETMAIADCTENPKVKQ